MKNVGQYLKVPSISMQSNVRPPCLVVAQELEVLSLSHLYSLKTKISQCHYVVMTRSETKFQAPLNHRYQEFFGEK